MKLVTFYPRSLNIGNILKSRFWFSVELKRQPVRVSFFSIGPTYNGTLTGLSIGYKCLVILAHIRGAKNPHP